MVTPSNFSGRLMHSVFGMLVIVAFAYAVSSSRGHIAWRTVGIAFVIQFTIGGLALFTSWGNRALSAAADATGALLSYSRAGIDFMFGQLAAYDGPIGFVFAVNVLPVVVFFQCFHSGDVSPWGHDVDCSIFGWWLTGDCSERVTPNRCQPQPIFLWVRPKRLWW